MFENFPEVLRPAQAQTMLNMGRTKFYSLLRNGEIPHRKIGGSYYIRKVDLIAFISPTTKR